MFTLAILLSHAALANDGPPPQLWAEQKAESVELTIQLHEDGEPGMGDPLALTRDGETLFDTSTLVAGDAFLTATECSSGLHGDCSKTPEKCFDCDGDGVAECNGWCTTYHRFLHVDACVVPGSHVYALEEEFYTAADASIEVTEHGVDCTDPTDSGDSGEDSGADDSADDGAADDSAVDDGDDPPAVQEDPDDGCGCAHAPPLRTLLLGALMMSAGLLLRRRA